MQSVFEEQLRIASEVVQRKEQALFKEREGRKTLRKQVHGLSVTCVRGTVGTGRYAYNNMHTHDTYIQWTRCFGRVAPDPCVQTFLALYSRQLSRHDKT